MNPELIHIYGPFSIHSYGLFIVVGLLIFTWLVSHDPKRSSILSRDQFINTVFFSILVGVIGGRFLFLLTEWQSIKHPLNMVSVWDGGLSLLGTILALLIFLPWYLTKYKINIISFFDLVAVYAPLLQAISRVGCFFAGCCYGRQTNVPWAVVYTNPKSLAPLCLHLHPTQLYSAGLLFLIFLLMYFFFQRKCTRPGQLVTLYLMFASGERFLVDFLRADREFLSIDQLLSIHQLIALAIFICSTSMFIWISRKAP